MGCVGVGVSVVGEGAAAVSGVVAGPGAVEGLAVAVVVVLLAGEVTKASPGAPKSAPGVRVVVAAGFGVGSAVPVGAAGLSGEVELPRLLRGCHRRLGVPAGATTGPSSCRGVIQAPCLGCLPVQAGHGVCFRVVGAAGEGGLEAAQGGIRGGPRRCDALGEELQQPVKAGLLKVSPGPSLTRAALTLSGATGRRGRMLGAGVGEMGELVVTNHLYG